MTHVRRGLWTKIQKDLKGIGVLATTSPVWTQGIATAVVAIAVQAADRVVTQNARYFILAFKELGTTRLMLLTIKDLSLNSTMDRRSSSA